MAASGAQRRLAGKPRARLDAFSYLAEFPLGLVCHIGDSCVAGNYLRPLPRRTHD